MDLGGPAGHSIEVAATGAETDEMVGVELSKLADGTDWAVPPCALAEGGGAAPCDHWRRT